MINLKETYGKRYRVTLNESWEGGDKLPDYEIVGKRGYIRMWGSDALELYLESIVLANRIEREHPEFKPKAPVKVVYDAFQASKTLDKRHLSHGK